MCSLASTLCCRCWLNHGLSAYQTPLWPHSSCVLCIFSVARYPCFGGSKTNKQPRSLFSMVPMVYCGRTVGEHWPWPCLGWNKILIVPIVSDYLRSTPKQRIPLRTPDKQVLSRFLYLLRFQNEMSQSTYRTRSLEFRPTLCDERCQVTVPLWSDR